MPDISRLVIEVDSKGVVTATGDLENFARVSSQTEKSISGFSRKMATDGDLAKNFGAFQLVVDRLPGPMKSVASGLMGMVSPATAAVSAVLEIGDAIVNFAKDSIQAFSDFEMIKVNLETVMGSAEQAGATFNELRDMAARTPFGVEGLANATVQLKQTGTAARDLIPVLTMLGDTSGGSSEKFNRIVANFAQIQSVGKASSMDLKQFALAGLPVYDMLQKLGVEGTATAEDVTKAFEMMAGEGGVFFNAMERGAETIQGKLANLNDDWKTFKANFAEITGLADLWKNILTGTAAAIEAANEEMAESMELSEARERLNTGMATSTDRYTIALYDATQAEINYQKAVERGNANEISLARSVLDYYNSILETYEGEKNLLDGMTEWREAYAEIQAQIKATESEINTAYQDTTEGQIQKIQEEIQKWEDLKNKIWEIARKDIFTGEVISSEELEMSSEYTSEIEAILRGLNEDLAKLIEQAGKVKHEFADWVELLSSATGYTRENVEEWKGLGTIERYAAELEAVQNRFLRASPDGGFIYEALGLNETDVFDNTARELQSLLQMMTEARLQGAPWSLDDASYRRLLELYEKAKEDSAGAGFREIMAEIAEEREKILSVSIDPIYEVLDRVKEEMRDSGISAPGTSQALDIIEGNSANYLAALQNRIAEADMSAFDIAVKRLMVEEQITKEAAEQGVKTLELLDAVSFLEDELGRLAGGSYVDFTRELGEAFRDGAVSSDEFSAAIKNMLKSLIDAMPQLLLNVGLQLISGKNWPLGLALIGASGLMSFVSGLTDSAEQEGRDEEAERLRRIQEQITDLIDAQRKQQEYYLTQKRKVDSTALSVNDAIITPKGTVYTHPEDYIIATKHPETMTGSGGIAPVNITVVNNAGAKISQQETIGADGTREIQIAVDRIVTNGIASGRYDGAFNAMNAKNQGRKVTT